MGGITMSQHKQLSKQRIELLDRITKDLAEHFDAVEIFVSVQDENEGTAFYEKGTGNYFARYGHVRQWVLSEEHCHNKAIEVEKNPEDDE